VPLGGYGAVEVVVIQAATYPKLAKPRILSVVAASYKRGQILHLQTQPDPPCGPGSPRMTTGERGFILVQRGATATAPIGFHGFVRLFRRSGTLMWSRAQ
jgi:hypothetical protein